MAGLNQMPSDLEITEVDNMKMCWAKGQTNPWATKPLLTASTMINSRLASPLHSLHRRTLLKKAHTLSHLLSYSNRIKQQQKQKAHHIVSTQLLSTGSMKSSVWPPLSLVYSAVTPHQQSIPDTFSARQCWKKVKTWMGYLFNTVHNNKLTTDPPKSQ